MNLQHNLIEITEVEAPDDYKVGDILEVCHVEYEGVNVLNTRQQYVHNHQFKQADEPVAEQDVIKQPANLSITECNDLLQEASEAKPLADGWYERTSPKRDTLVLRYIEDGQQAYHPTSEMKYPIVKGYSFRPIKVDLS